MKKVFFVALSMFLFLSYGCSSSTTGTGNTAGSAPSSTPLSVDPSPTALPAVQASVTLPPATQIPEVTPSPRTSANASPLIAPVPANATPAPDPVASPATTGAAEKKTDEPVFVFFYADWCSACKEMRPIIDELKAEYTGRIGVALINVDDPRARELVMTFRVRAIPFMVLLMPNGDLAGQWVGGQDESVLRKAFEDVLSGPQGNK